MSGGGVLLLWSLRRAHYPITSSAVALRGWRDLRPSALAALRLTETTQILWLNQRRLGRQRRSGIRTYRGINSQRRRMSELGQ
jgi:hypothetical protein